MRAVRLIVVTTQEGEELDDERIKEIAERHLRSINEELGKLDHDFDLPGGSL